MNIFASEFRFEKLRKHRSRTQDRQRHAFYTGEKDEKLNLEDIL